MRTALDAHVIKTRVWIRKLLETQNVFLAISRLLAELLSGILMIFHKHSINDSKWK